MEVVGRDTDMPFSLHVKDFLHFSNLISRNNFRRDIS